MTRLLSRQLLLSSDLRLTEHIDLSVPDAQAYCLDRQVVEDFRPHCLVVLGDFLAMANQFRSSPPHITQGAL